MFSSLGKKIEVVRRESEAVRMKYVVVSVSVSMVFIMAVWLLSVRDSAEIAASDLPQVIHQGKDAAAQVPSLNDLFQKSAPLRIEDTGIDGSQFFQGQVLEKVTDSNQTSQ